ncbi:NADH-quinone oxidoreductase subunit H [bacterium]|nr:NADH-quinone oxidoreductase subunit H [bacterium]
MASTVGLILSFLIFPGLLFTAVGGLATQWVDRKVSALVQWRVGPPWYQPFADILKLLGKEIIVPAGAKRAGFFLAPLAGLAAIAIVSMILWLTNLRGTGFVGDLVGVLYLLTIPSLGIILGASSSSNPLSSVGASREMKLVLAYELPFVIAIFTAVTKVAPMTLRLDSIVQYQEANGVLLGSPSCILAFIVCILVAQAKLTYPPFDIPEAETEIMDGTHMEYSGAALAVIKLQQAMMLFTLPVFFITLFWGGLQFHGWSILYTIAKYLIIVTIIVLIKNTNPRVRIDQAVRFFWGPISLIAVVGMVLAILGF